MKRLDKISCLFLACILSLGCFAQINFCGEALPLTNDQVAGNFLNVLYKVNKRSGPAGLYKRAKKYFPYIESMLAEYGIPDDFKFLPLIETAFYNYGPNHVGAAGVWAIMPATARMFDGLRITAEVDERMDFEKATKFSMRLIRWLYDRLGSWTLTAAAYNGGVGRIEKKIRQHGHKNYYTMSLCDETAEYVLKMVTLKELFNSGLNIEKIEEKMANIRVGNTDSKLLAETLKTVSFDVEEEKVRGLFNSMVFPSTEFLNKKATLDGTVIGFLNGRVTVKVNGSYIAGTVVSVNGEFVIEIDYGKGTWILKTKTVPASGTVFEFLLK